MASITEFLEAATPERKSVNVCPDRTLVGKLADAEKRLGEAGTGMLGDKEKAAIEKEVAALRAEVESKTETFVFRSIGHLAWQDLLAKHPPTDKQSGILDHNPDTFYTAALSATCESHEMTEGEANRFIAAMPLGVVSKVMGAVFEANVEGSPDPFVAPTAEARRFAKK